MQLELRVVYASLHASVYGDVMNEWHGGAGRTCSINSDDLCKQCLEQAWGDAVLAFEAVN